MPGLIWLGDLVRTLHGLGGFDSAERFDRVVGCLGFDVAAPAAAQDRRDASADVSDWVPPSDTSPEPPPEDAPPVTAIDRLAAVGEQSVEPKGLSPDGPRLADATPAAQRLLAPLLPLLPPRSGRSLLQLLLSRHLPDGPVDVPRLVELLAYGRHVTELPRLAERTLRFGVQVLVDVGEGMAPFRRDEFAVADEVRNVIGAALTQVRYFADVPLRGCGPGARWTWVDYRPPPAGTRVLVVSDFGIGGPLSHISRGSMTEWAAFVDLIRRSGSDAVGLVPYGRDRWPDRLADLLPAVTWDRTLTATVANLAGR